MGLTIFSIPKAFAGQIDRAQRNALKSWRRQSDVEIVLMGDDAGVADAAAAFDAGHVAEIERTAHGTPRLDVAFAQARKMARHDTLCFVNADIILPPDFAEVVAGVSMRPSLVVGARWERDVEGSLDFDSDATDAMLRSRAGDLGPPFAIDYFVFHRDINWSMPAFAIGRTVWDNWMIFRARQLRVPVIDATRRLFVIHQSHDYSHIAPSRSALWKGTEAEENRRLAGLDRLFTIEDATHVMTEDGTVKRAMDARHLRQRWANRPLLSPWLRPVYRRVLHVTRRARGLDPAL
jgi:hypothetical protein